MAIARSNRQSVQPGLLMPERHPLDHATTLTRLDTGRFRGATSPAYANFKGPYGGVTAATLLRAVLDDQRCSADPVAMTVNFCTVIADGDFDITTRIHRTGRYTQHWSADLTQGDTTCATASIVCGARQDSFSHQAAAMPDAPDPATIDPLPMGGMMEWLQRYEYRYVSGAPKPPGKPLAEPRDSRSVLWIRDMPDRPLDFLALAALSDCFLLRLYQVRAAFVPMGTVSLTTYFHASAANLAEQGSAPLLGTVKAKQFHASFHDQHMELWSKTGRLLATGMQVAWYKG